MNLLEKIRATISQRRLLNRGDRIVVAVSGGPDSIALLHLLLALRDAWQLELHVAHLNHQLRGAIGWRCEFVALFARKWDCLSPLNRDVLPLTHASVSLL
jgi:tRNA(Ile)-lysidine synthase